MSAPLRYAVMIFVLRTINENMQSLLRSHALAVILAVIFFEELGVPSPIPGDLMMVLAGVRVAQGHEPLWLVLLLQEMGRSGGRRGCSSSAGGAAARSSCGTGDSSTSARRIWRARRTKSGGTAAGRS